MELFQIIESNLQNIKERLIEYVLENSQDYIDGIDWEEVFEKNKNAILDNLDEEEFNVVKHKQDDFFDLLYTKINFSEKKFQLIEKEISDIKKESDLYERNVLGYHGLKNSDFL